MTWARSHSKRFIPKREKSCELTIRRLVADHGWSASHSEALFDDRCGRRIGAIKRFLSPQEIPKEFQFSRGFLRVWHQLFRRVGVKIILLISRLRFEYSRSGLI